MQQGIRIKDIELGKPDAKDEVLYADSLEAFCDRIILPPNFDIRNLIDKEKCYIVGNKGVGKTALLFYINNLLLKEDPESVCSMILFKSDVTAAKRASMDKVEKIRISNMSIANEELNYVRDFSKLWTLVIYKKIIEDNKKFEVFERDTNWNSFENLICQLDNEQSEVLRFVKKIPENAVCFDANQGAYIGNRVEYPADESDYALANFFEVIEFADKLFCSLKMTNHKYYICIDELEAYNGNREIYIRDLTMIRDLIITTKRINALLRQNRINNIKIILSVRTEMVRSISRELPGLEYNKHIEGFAEKISWSGPLVDFVYHPLSAIWIKRIQESMCEQYGVFNSNKIYDEMFPHVIGMDDIIDFVIERTWQKPRDIIRLMSCLHNEVDDNAYYYKPEDFVKAMPEYSRQSKEELVEELGAIYTNAEIEKIFTCLTAYKKHFTRNELEQRLNANVASTCKTLNVNKIIDDLYRIGVIGLINFSQEDELWGFLGKTAVVDENWRYLIHRGLWSELSLEKEAYEGVLYTDIVGKTFKCEVSKRDGNYLMLSFSFEQRKMKGTIHAKNITGKHENLDKYVGKTINAFVTGYNSRRNIWELSIIRKKIL